MIETGWAVEPVDSLEGNLPRILTELGIGLVIGDIDRAVFVNDAFSALTGYSVPELLALGSFVQLVFPHEGDLTGMVSRRLAGGQVPRRYEADLLCKDGLRIPVEVAAHVVMLDGRAEVIATFRDLREHKRVEAELATRARQQAAVAELGARAMADTGLSALMDVAVATVARTLGVDCASVLELLPGGEALLMRAGVGSRPGQVGHATTGAGLDSQAGFTLLSNAPVVVEDYARESRFRPSRLIVDHGIVSGMSIIISGPDGPWGVLGAFSGRRRAFSSDDIAFFQATANILAGAIRRADVEGALRASRDEERELRQRLEAHSRMVVSAQEGERRRIARELHDEIGQTLTGLKLVLESCERLAPSAAADGLGRARGLVGELLQQVHDLSLDLRPAMLDDLGLRAGLLWLVERYTAQTGVEVTLRCSSLAGRLLPEVETAAYRIVQEALTNVARHAHVSAARVDCVLTEDSLGIEVSDGGDGFDVGSVRPGQSSGLVGMEERARSTGGHLRLVSQAGSGHGTRVIAELPTRERSIAVP